ncbi:SRPBCC domain-containing protein [Massilia sp. H-1]|nr:SRPBCC domain-containing protein [Massilia sp. H-1]
MWWGPDGYRTTTWNMDVVVGGQWRYTMHGPDGTDYENLVTYTEIVRPERLCYDLGEPDDPVQFKSTVTFEEAGA